MATATNTLWTLATVRSWVGITDGSETSQDAVLEQIADAVTEFIERDTQCVFVTRGFVEIRDGDGSNRLFLRQFPVQTFTSLTIRRSPTETTPETVDTSLYRVETLRGIVDLHSTILTKGRGNVTATYTAGYGAQDAATLPQDIVLVGLDLVKMIFDKKTHNAISAQSISLGGANFLIREELPKHVQLTLEQWRRRFV